MNDSAVCDEMLELAAAAALDALEHDEAERVEQHAARCPTCASALQEFREAAAVLGSSVPQVEPPAALRTRVFDAVHQTPREPVREPRRMWPRALRGSRTGAAWVAVAASLALSAVAMVRIAMLQTEVASLREQADRASRYEHVVEVLSSNQLAIRQLQPVAQAVQSKGTVYLDPSSGTGMVMCHDLPPIEPGHAYQVWFVRGTERVSGGMLWPDGYGNGYTLIQVPQDVQSFDSIGLTDEPGNGGRGSAWPTTPRVIGTTLGATAQ